MVSPSITIAEVMTKGVITVKPIDTMTTVQGLFSAKGIHHLPVVNSKDEVVGIVSKTDFYRLEHGFTLFKSKESSSYNDAIMRSLLVQDVMTEHVVTLLPENSVYVAVDIFKENLFHAIPVVNEKSGLVGIVTTYDLLNYAYSG